jgi:hypothetical protein
MIDRLAGFPVHRRMSVLFWVFNATIAGGLLIFALRAVF